MAGLDLGAIRTALAEQIRQNIARGTNVYERPVGDPKWPSITIVAPTEEYVSYFGTFGGNGVADILLDVELEVAGAQPDVHVALDDYLSAGAGKTSSIVDAIHSDRTLGGVVGDCVCLTSAGPQLQETDTHRAVLRVQVIVNKIGANA